ncbi:acetylesterase, partial [Actinotalea sp. C106]|uniref:acetylesterase n=1 Tax=Actinotalea sp. C106 TaxID=2908644 RepID=UPI002027A506
MPDDVTAHYAHLGVFSDWVTYARGPRERAVRRPAAVVRRLAAETLAAPGSSGALPEEPVDLRVEARWTADGVDGVELTWSVGFGPRTRAWLLRPAGVTRRLPGILALHSHDGHKRRGLEKLADGPVPAPASIVTLRAGVYGGRAVANGLARAGHAVLVHDVLGWGSRGFPLEEMPPLLQELARRTRGMISPGAAEWSQEPGQDDVALYDAAAWHHEHLLEKYCTLLGTSYAAQVAREDRIALAVLAGDEGTADRLGAVGLSGGGARVVLLRATTDAVDAAVVVAMMSTYDALLDQDVVSHTWMMMPAGLAGHVDWPDLVACRAPQPLLVQY